MIISSSEGISCPDIFYEIKDFLINYLEESVIISPSKNSIIESSSGNLGIVLSVVCKSHGYKFTCVIDPNTAEEAEEYMKIYGVRILKVTLKDKVGGYLNTRIKFINSLLEQDKNLAWTNQYASEVNITAHYNTTVKYNNIVDNINHIMTANTSPYLTKQKFSNTTFINCSIGELIAGQYKLSCLAKPTVISPMGLGVLDKL